MPIPKIEQRVLLTSNSTQNQTGLATIEFCLMAPVIALFVYLILNTSKSMLLHEQRVIAARNSAYLTETYFRGDIEQNNRLAGKYPTIFDSVLGTFDEGMNTLEGLDNTLATGNEIIGIANRTMGDFGVDTEVGNLPSLPKNLVSRVFGTPVISYSERSNNTLDPSYKQSFDKAENAVAINLATKYYDINIHHTVGTSVSDYLSPIGKHAANGVVMRQFHIADFADTLDIPTAPSLANGYKDEMWNLLQPDKYFQDTFAGRARHRNATGINLNDLMSEMEQRDEQVRQRESEGERDIEERNRQTVLQQEERERQRRCANSDQDNLPDECR